MIDITRYLDRNTLSWPGDTSFKSERVCSIEHGSSVNLSTIKTSVHNGTHADAPWHYDDALERIDELSLDAFVGPCVVIPAADAWPIQPSALHGVDVRPGDRVLFKTSDHVLAQWTDENSHLSVETVIALSQINCRLVGIDSASVDPATDTDLLAHAALGRSGIQILENLDLTNVSPGRYILVALPLKLRGLDASPVRAVLYTVEEWSAIGAD